MRYKIEGPPADAALAPKSLAAIEGHTGQSRRLLERLLYLSCGLATILAFIGVKLVLHALHENNVPLINDGEPVRVVEISTLQSLVVIVGILADAEQTVRSLPDEYRALIQERHSLREMLADAHARQAAAAAQA
ncbi:hypothetical protein [Ramlibacter sp. AN1133]|uniref:hypothetical protein n=1 Tax=Ramlibacter sp. AN1133 TaxID=3133429 RepID=UPI0030BC6372